MRLKMIKKLLHILLEEDLKQKIEELRKRMEEKTGIRVYNADIVRIAIRRLYAEKQKQKE